MTKSRHRIRHFETNNNFLSWSDHFRACALVQFGSITLSSLLWRCRAWWRIWRSCRDVLARERMNTTGLRMRGRNLCLSLNRMTVLRKEKDRYWLFFFCSHYRRPIKTVIALEHTMGQNQYTAEFWSTLSPNWGRIRVTVFWSFHQHADFIPPSFARDKLKIARPDQATSLHGS